MSIARRSLCALPWAVLLAVVSCKDAVVPRVPTTLVPGAGSVTFSAFDQTRALAATVLDQDGAPLTGLTLTWTASPSGVVTVSAAGIATAVGNGDATVTVAAGTATAQIAVSVQQVPASLGLSTGTASFTSLGDTLRLVATVADAGGSPIVAAPVAWSALDTAVVSVAADGLVMASGNGTTRVFAVAGGTLASALVTVAQTADALVLSADSVGLSALGDTVSLSAMVSDAGGSPVAQPAVIWASTDTSVAKVSAAGVVTAVDNGSALVTVTADSVVGQAQVVASSSTPATSPPCVLPSSPLRLQKESNHLHTPSPP
jgi:hypothetical protein